MADSTTTTTATTSREECKRAGAGAAPLNASTSISSKRRKLGFYCEDEEERTALLSPPLPRAAALSTGKIVPPTPQPTEFCSGDSWSSSCFDRLALSRFSSSCSNEIVEELVEDPEVKSLETETSTCITANFSRESSPSNQPCENSESKTMERSPAKPPSASNRRRPTVTKMPPQAEIEEFFSAAEKYEQKRFTEKYNYDIVTDVPSKADTSGFV